MARRGRESLGLGARLRRSAPRVHHPLAEGRGELTSFSESVFLSASLEEYPVQRGEGIKWPSVHTARSMAAPLRGINKGRFPRSLRAGDPESSRVPQPCEQVAGKGGPWDLLWLEGERAGLERARADGASEEAKVARAGVSPACVLQAQGEGGSGLPTRAHVSPALETWRGANEESSPRVTTCWPRNSVN